MATRPEVFVPVTAPEVRLGKRGLALFWQRWGIQYVFIAPYLLLFAVFTIAPVLTAMYLSFTYFNILEPPRWIGWANYRLLFLEDDVFLIAVRNTLEFAIITGPV